MNWDQFAANEKLFGLKTNFDEEIYTTRLDRSAPDYKTREKRAAEMAAEIQKVCSTLKRVQRVIPETRQLSLFPYNRAQVPMFTLWKREVLKWMTVEWMRKIDTVQWYATSTPTSICLLPCESRCNNSNRSKLARPRLLLEANLPTEKQTPRRRAMTIHCKSCLQTIFQRLARHLHLSATLEI